MSGIKLENITKKYGNTTVIENLNLEIQEGERMVFLGPSGCGKSTTLRMIAGLESISGGKLYMDGEDRTHLPSGKRDVAMVFQNYALYPNMSVINNITFGLRANRVESGEISNRLDKALKMLRLEEYKDRLPKDLSGGQRQRVALARAIVKRSKFFLLDEPLSNLDVTLRQEARNELIEIHDMYKQTFIYVTHDQVEAMTLGHRIVLMNRGQIQMVGTPEEVYNYPANMFTAAFIGSPKMNLQPVAYQDGVLMVGSQELKLTDRWNQHIQTLHHNKLVVGVRPEHINIFKEPVHNSIKAHVKFTENLGPNYAVHIATNTSEWVAISYERDWGVGDECYVAIDMNKIHIFDQDTEMSLGYPAR